MMEAYAEGLRAKKTKKIPHVCSADRVVSDTGVPGCNRDSGVV